jgi:hypothetical protein
MMFNHIKNYFYGVFKKKPLAPIDGIYYYDVALAIWSAYPEAMKLLTPQDYNTGKEWDFNYESSVGIFLTDKTKTKVKRDPCFFQTVASALKVMHFNRHPFYRK